MSRPLIPCVTTLFSLITLSSPAAIAADYIQTSRNSRPALQGSGPFNPAPTASTKSAARSTSFAATATSENASPPCWVGKRTSSGKEVSALSGIDNAVKNFLHARQIPSGNLVVRYKGTVVLERGYGWKDSACTSKMPYNGMYRIASLTKPVTNALVYALFKEGRLRPDDKVFCVTTTGRCVLPITGFKNYDPRLKDITVQHLTDHSAGWDANQSGNPTDDVRAVATALGIPSPPSKADIIRHHVSNRNLDFAPGTYQTYSNFGYVVLGQVIERAAGKAYYAYLQQALLNPMGIPASDMKVAGTLTRDLDPREPHYATPDEGDYRNVYDLTPDYVPLAYGGFHIEAGGGAGMLLTSARAYSRFLRDYWISGTAKVDQPCNCLYLFYGSIPGAFSMAYQPNEDVDITLFFAQSYDKLQPWQDYGSVRDAIDVAMSKITTWPTKPPSGHQP